MHSPDLSIIIVSWNVWSLLETCLHGVERALIAPHTYEVIVVDNASDDGTPARLRAHFQEVRLIANECNRLYTAAANQGLEIARGRHLLLLNPDTELSPGSLSRLIDYADSHPQAGLLGPRIRTATGADDLRTGRHYPTPWSEMLDWLGLTHRFPRNPVWAAHLRPGFDRKMSGAVPLLSGACLMLSQQLPSSWRKLDASYPMYAEDVDLNRRVQAAGFETHLVGDSVILHLGGASSGQRKIATALLAIEGIHRYFWRWCGPGTAQRHRFAMFLVAASKVLVAAGAARLTGQKEMEERHHLYRHILRWALKRPLDPDIPPTLHPSL